MVNLMDRWVPHDRAWGLGSVETSGTAAARLVSPTSPRWSLERDHLVS